MKQCTLDENACALIRIPHYKKELSAHGTSCDGTFPQQRPAHDDVPVSCSQNAVTLYATVLFTAISLLPHCPERFQLRLSQAVHILDIRTDSALTTSGRKKPSIIVCTAQATEKSVYDNVSLDACHDRPIVTHDFEGDVCREAGGPFVDGK